jgi:hypothetical protein
VISAADVAAAARTTLETHLPLALSRLARPLPTPTSYSEVPTFEAIRFVKRSVVAVSVPNIIDQPERFGDGSYDAVWLLSIAVWHEQAKDLPLLTAAADYVTAIRKTLLSHQNLGGLATATTWTGESVDLVGDATTPVTLGFGICEFAVRVPQVVDETPLSPDDTDGPVVTESTVYVNPQQ